jgi:hypothetical protein
MPFRESCGCESIEVGDAVDVGTTASPSSTKLFCRNLRAASKIQGYRVVQL